MRVKVHGLTAQGDYYWRIVTVREFYRLWGRFADHVFAARRSNPLIVEDKAVWTELVK